MASARTGPPPEGSPPRGVAAVVVVVIDPFGLHLLDGGKQQEQPAATEPAEEEDEKDAGPEEDPAPALESIAVETAPNKVEYLVGESLDASGLVLRLSYDDDSEQTLAYTADNAGDFAFDPTSFNSAGGFNITVTYGGLTATFGVTVSEAQPQSQPQSSPAPSSGGTFVLPDSATRLYSTDELSASRTGTSTSPVTRSTLVMVACSARTTCRTTSTVRPGTRRSTRRSSLTPWGCSAAPSSRTPRPSSPSSRAAARSTSRLGAPMPSWNIHTAHVERLLREQGAEALGVRDWNAFLLGNLAPDIYVGYMVPDTTLRIDYKLTHHSIREHIPLPRYDEFWNYYIAGHDDVSDVTLGAWAHLVADHVYNAHTRAYLASIGVEAGERARIGKQGDFALFGRTLDISLVPHVDEALVAQCAAFPPYSILERDVRGAVDAARAIVEKNRAEHLTETPAYRLLTAEFFDVARDEAHTTIVAGLRSRL